MSRYNKSIPLEYRRVDPLTAETKIERPGEPDIFDALTALVFSSEWNSSTLLYSFKQHNINKNYTISQDSQNTTTYEASADTTEMSCSAVSVLYDVEVRFLRGVRTIRHSMSDMKTTLSPADARHTYDPWYATKPASSNYSLSTLKEFHDWCKRSMVLFPLSNEWALLDALGTILQSKFYEDTVAAIPGLSTPQCQQKSKPTNATTEYDCAWEGDHWNPANSSCKTSASLYLLHNLIRKQPR
jgi:hypothetical protein